MRRDNLFGNDADDLFNQVLRNMGNAQGARYIVNGQELTPEEFTKYRTTGKLPAQAKEISVSEDEAPALKQGGILEKLGRNLTQEARDELLDPVIGRDKEIQETAEILSRRIKNNPILVGDAGVGKTSVVEGLAQAIAAGKVPSSIRDKEIYSIDLSALEAGTKFRGSFEENINNLVKEVKAAGNIILFFDEIHQIIGVGSAGGEDGGKGLADIIKPSLSRGDLTVIGATTQDEYRNTILKDAALARRFNDVIVNEPSPEDTVAILKGVKKLYENHHHVKLTDDVIKAAVDYSIQYIPQRTLPDKAIDLIDMTAAHLAASEQGNNIDDLKAQVKKLTQSKAAKVASEDYQGANEDKHKLEVLQKQIDDIDENGNDIVATVNDVAKAVERLTGIPVSKLGTSDIERLKKLDERLKAKIIGQDEAVEMISRAIRRNRAGFAEGNQPIGSFLFVGPTGVGKTELAKQLAYDMFGNKEN